MIVGTVRPDEAKVFDQDAGVQHIEGHEHPVMIEWLPNHRRGAGWYHYIVNDDCEQAGDSVGPFASSSRALADAESPE